ncbi:histidine phosphatase family protein [Roseateles koreensis]|uniref:Histidine phosphatase family protein n=1 Tax=Roseateles koreensis TaxID=2987526 RepID=A0ABT5KQJ9_9BURK|nr:histidine phosphatase family protein [Roseateles koreensis]MDC8784057.1 histidine phosphatase family protein [Roseateles koreensis]
MGTIYLVRHGQASLGADDYDQLSQLGRQQCELLGRYWRARGLRFDAVLTGTLKRHTQSLAGIAEGLGEALPAEAWPGLNEYDSEALIQAIHPGVLDRPTTAEGARQHFRLLRDGLKAWMEGRTAPTGMPSHVDFTAGVMGALAHVQQMAADRPEAKILLVSSGGPISTAVAQVLGVPGEGAIELNLRLRNCAVTEFALSPRRMALLSFNSVAHLDEPGLQALQSYA